MFWRRFQRKWFVMSAAPHQPNSSPDTWHAGTGQDSRSESGGPAVPRSRMGGLWVAFILFAVVLLLLLIFVLENGQRAEVPFFGAHGHLPMGVALLLAAIFGVLLVALPGTARIVQLRMLGRRGGRDARPRRAAAAVIPAPDDSPGQQPRR